MLVLIKYIPNRKTNSVLLYFTVKHNWILNGSNTIVQAKRKSSEHMKTSCQISWITCVTFSKDMSLIPWRFLNPRHNRETIDFLRKMYFRDHRVVQIDNLTKSNSLFMWKVDAWLGSIAHLSQQRKWEDMRCFYIDFIHRQSHQFVPPQFLWCSVQHQQLS